MPVPSKCCKVAAPSCPERQVGRKGIVSLPSWPAVDEQWELGQLGREADLQQELAGQSQREPGNAQAPLAGTLSCLLEGTPWGSPRRLGRPACDSLGRKAALLTLPQASTPPGRPGVCE